jgi:phosphotransferase system  glucose/maltose/N-acetylglucosamine-specific IIC component
MNLFENTPRPVTRLMHVAVRAVFFLALIAFFLVPADRLRAYGEWLVICMYMLLAAIWGAAAWFWFRAERHFDDVDPGNGVRG